MKKQCPSDLAISVITLLEIEYGFKLRKSKYLDNLYNKWKLLLDVINVVQFSNNTALIAADIRALLKHQGKMIGAYDILIAASAIEHQIVCVTNNLTEFSRIEKLPVIDWS